MSQLSTLKPANAFAIILDRAVRWVEAEQTQFARPIRPEDTDETLRGLIAGQPDRLCLDDAIDVRDALRALRTIQAVAQVTVL